MPKSTVKGVDVDFTLTPSSAFTLRGAITHISTKVTEVNQVFFSGDGSVANILGKNLSYAPPWSGTLDAEYQIPASENIDIVLGAGGQFYSYSYSSLGEGQALKNPHYYTADLRAGVQHGDRWRATLWVRNVTDKDYFTSIFTGGDATAKTAGQPRTIGASAAFNF